MTSKPRVTPALEIENADDPNPPIEVIVLPPPPDAARAVANSAAFPCPMLMMTIDDALALTNSQLTWFGRCASDRTLATPPV